MDYYNPEISDLYDVYSREECFLYHKEDVTIEKKRTEKHIFLCDIYSNHECDFLYDKEDVYYIKRYTPLYLKDVLIQSFEPYKSMSFRNPKYTHSIKPQNICLIENDSPLSSDPFQKSRMENLREKYQRQKRNARKKHIIFLETNYLEHYFEETTIFIISNQTMTIDAMFLKNGNRDKYTFVIPIEYPFVPPYVFINDVPYMNLIKCCHLERVKLILGKYTRYYRPFLNCISCASFVNPKNWDEKTRFSDIFLEWFYIRHMKQIVSYELGLDSLRLARGLEYYIMVCIMEYLFSSDRISL